MSNHKTYLAMTTAIAFAVAPTVAFGQTAAAPGEARGGMSAQAPDGTAGNPPSTATQRALDGVTGNRTAADGTANNPPGTAAGRAMDRATDGTTAQAPANRGTMGATGTTATGATTPTMSVDSMSLRESRRASQIIGSNIYNEENNSIGEVDDLIVPQAGGAPVAVISVGGFLGIGAKLVAIPYERLSHDAERNRWMLRGATKESLESLPSFSYDANARRG
ncbi:PRC-barrel domain-containing protein [Falsiroseomonas selenitidurans]|uniref:PRC-barrel domain containing protein n=1 Tax=Falsiroseomonas selenitidurans TaxID=2716335 RepID=A0ABX1E952_9PROT|nr:PRC-barrel domain-containing protein [Falsiroseomonas selenitidurans]NKC33722.1 PRC-barrel domain containing protein [Falsiroseomonas selenitidurans]